MATAQKVVEGMLILLPYYENQNSYHIGADHDVIYMYATDRPVSESDIEALIERGWFQDTCESSDEFLAKDYDPSESWATFV